ncbi:glycosyltransferase family 4 protein [Paenibacillus physcomitrellae]|uniref:Glycosyl transferase n=1 Tax=Paenibacillus physcomitrellae TaxID=1619311 RepID=A0ABQ1G2B9_9BACL|nr:glycosyltransferase family 4 protein [Paenibacillus physcomitrellae]GGA35976.1 glycosyl transferase [Paenibacillus physcomitrellae]
MRFTFPVLTLCQGGAQRMLAELTNWLSARGHEVTLVMPAQGVVEYAISSRVHRVEQSVLKAEDFPNADVIVSNFYTTVYPAAEASTQGKGVHVRLALCYEPVFLSDNFASFPTYSMTEHLLVLSRWEQQLIQIIHGIGGMIVPVGVSSFFHNMNFRNQLAPGLRITAVVRSVTPSFSWHRDQEYLLYELARVKHQYPDVDINLICPPAEYEGSPELQQLGANGLFRIVTPADDTELRYLYNMTDIFVSSSVYDAGGLPGLEAMRCGASLVTLYSGGNADYCRPEVNCLMSYRYENRLGEDISRLIVDPVLRSQLAATGQADSYHFTWDKSAADFEHAVQVLLTRTS